MSFLFLAPVKTILPETKIKTTSLGSSILKTRPGNTSGSYEQNSVYLFDTYSKSKVCPISQEATMFYILNWVNWTGFPNFWIILANFLEAIFAQSSVLEPVHTIFPDAKIKAVVFGIFSLIITAANLQGLYSAFLACKAICLRLRGQFRFTVATMFYNWGRF